MRLVDQEYREISLPLGYGLDSKLSELVRECMRYKPPNYMVVVHQVISMPVSERKYTVILNHYKLEGNK